MKWHTSQDNLIGPGHPYGLPYEPRRASVITPFRVTLALILLVGVIKVVNSGGNPESPQTAQEHLL